MPDELKVRKTYRDPITHVNIIIHHDADTDAGFYTLDDLEQLCISYRRSGQDEGFDFLVDKVEHRPDGRSFLVGRLVDENLAGKSGSTIGEFGQPRWLEVGRYDYITVY